MVELINSKIDEPEYLVRPFIKPGEKGYLVAGYKVGKTFYLLQEILSLAQGASDFLGFEIPKPRKVLYIRFELSRYEVQRRLRQMLRKLHKEMSQDPMLFLKKGFDLTNPDEKDLNWLFGQIDLCEPDFLIFDPLFKLTSLNLAEPKSATPLLRAYEKILIRYPKLSIQTAHHMVKMSKDKDSDSWDSSYGPVQFFADMDYEMRLRKIRDEEPKRFKLDFLTNSELVDKIELERDPSTLLYKVVKESPMQKKAYEDQANLEAMSRILKRSGRINQTTFEKSCKEELSIGQDLFKRLSGLGSDIGYSGFGGYTQHPFWKKSKIKNLVFYEPCDIGG